MDSTNLQITINSITKNEPNYYSFFNNYNVLILNDDFKIISNILKNGMILNQITLFLIKISKYKEKILNDNFLNKLYIYFSEKI